MRELTPEQLAEKFPHGWRVEVKRQRKPDGSIREYSCRRAKRAPKPPREPPIKEKLLGRVSLMTDDEARAVYETLQSR